MVKPTMIFSVVMTTAAKTEFPAAARFSARIRSVGEMAGLPDMQSLSSQAGESAKRIERNPHPPVKNAGRVRRPAVVEIVIGSLVQITPTTQSLGLGRLCQPINRQFPSLNKCSQILEHRLPRTDVPRVRLSPPVTF